MSRGPARSGSVDQGRAPFDDLLSLTIDPPVQEPEVSALPSSDRFGESWTGEMLSGILCIIAGRTSQEDGCGTERQTSEALVTQGRL